MGTRYFIRRLLEGAVIVEMLKPGILQDFANNIQAKLKI
jgi:hypothetical protein